MPREVRLIRRIIAQPGGWGGDVVTWTEALPPTPALWEVGTTPILTLPLERRERRDVLVRGAAGYFRVYGPDAARRFNMSIYLGWLRIEGNVRTRDWRGITGLDPRDIGDGESWSTDPLWLQDQQIAFHLMPIGGSFGSGSTVEIWGAEI